jgi:hypothetical protein
MDSFWWTDRVVQKLRKSWKPEFTGDAVRLLAHDSSEVRWFAMQALQSNAAPSFAPILDKLLMDPDLRVRGLSIYLAVSRRKQAAFSAVREFLKSDCAPLRFDAIYALRMHGADPAEELLHEHAAKEKHPSLK